MVLGDLAHGPAKLAVTDRAWSMLTVHVVLKPLELQSPPQPLKMAVWPGCAVSVTSVPSAYQVEQLLPPVPQSMAAGSLVTVPLPWTVTVNGCMAVNEAVTDRA